MTLISLRFKDALVNGKMQTETTVSVSPSFALSLLPRRPREGQAVGVHCSCLAGS